MFIKNSNVVKCRETKWPFLSKNIENRLCTQAMLKTEDFFELTVPVKKKSQFLYIGTKCCYAFFGNSYLLFQPVVFFRF